VHNTVVTTGAAVNVRNVTGTVLIANNAVYSQSGSAIRLISGDVSQLTLSGNVGAGGLAGGISGYTEGNGIGSDFVNGHFGVPPIDLFPAPGGALIGVGDPAYVTATDFNETPRQGAADVGAYHFQPGGNPGWPISAGFKQLGGDGSVPKPPVVQDN
jgi:hypothetical protein